MCFAQPNQQSPIFMKRHMNRRRQHLMMAACILDMLDEDEEKSLRGRLLGSKTIRQTRKKVKSMFAELGWHARKAWRMSLDTFLILHETLQERLEEDFNDQKRTRGGVPNGEIPTKLCLSAAIRYFAGASIYDIILTHGMSKQSIYSSVYGVVNVAKEVLSFCI